MHNIFNKPAMLATVILMAICLNFAMPVESSEMKRPGSYAPASVYEPGGNRYLMVFTDVDEFMVPGIYGIFVRPDASPEGTPFRISGKQAFISPEARPSVALDPEGRLFLVTWHDWRTGNPDIYAGILNSSGHATVDDFAISKGPAEETYPVAAFSPEAESFLVSWQDSRSGNKDIYARTLTISQGDPDEENVASLDEEFAIYKAPGKQSWVSIAYRQDKEGGAYYFLAFEDQSEGASTPTISGQLVDTVEGKTLLPVKLGLDISGDQGGHAPSVTSTSSDEAPFMVAWHGPLGDLRARYMDTTGSSDSPLDRVFEPEGREGAAGRVRLSSDPSTGRSALFWQEYSGDQHDIYASFIEPGDTSGSVYHVMQVAGDEDRDEINLDVSYNSRMPSFLVAYESTDYLTSFNILLTSVTDPDYPEITVTDPVYPFEDLSVEYPGILFNTAVSHTLSVYNDSPYEALRIMNINASGPFTVAGENCTLGSVPPSGEPCSVTVEFMPGGGGASSGMLSIVSDDPNEPETTLHLAGTGLAPRMEITDTSMPSGDRLLDFGMVPLGTASEGTVTVRNTGDHVLSIDMVRSHSPDFGIRDDNCSLQALMPSGFCTVVLYASPSIEGLRTGSIWISSDDPETGDVLVSLSAEGAVASMKAVTGTPGIQGLNFGGQLSGSRTEKKITIRNNGSAPLLISSIEKTGEAFSVKADKCSGRELHHNSACSIRVLFSPHGTQALSGAITLESSDPTAPETIIPLYGFGAMPIASVYAGGPGERRLRFGNPEPGSSMIHRVKITNIGQAQLKTGLSNIKGQGFSITSDECRGRSLPYAASCEISVLYSPGVTGYPEGRLAIPTNDPEEKIITVTLSGSGQ